jgi:hypothetical protein
MEFIEKAEELDRELEAANAPAEEELPEAQEKVIAEEVQAAVPKYTDVDAEARAA